MEIISFILALICVLTFLGIFFSIFKIVVIISAISLIIYGCAILFVSIKTPVLIGSSTSMPIIIILIGIILLKIIF